MKNTTRWYGWIALTLPLHMCEQMVFGIDELARLKRILAVYYHWFHQPDYGTVLLVTIIGTLFISLTYGILRGGTPREISLAVWALIAISEVHHLIESLIALRYTPGTVTALLSFIFGILLMRAVMQERRERLKTAAPTG